MDFLLSERQIELQNMAQNEVLANFTSQHIRETECSTECFSRDIWHEGIKRGWPGIAVPEEFGGSGGGLLDMCALLEEIGRSGALLPLVASAGISAKILLSAPQSAQRDRCISEIAAGKIFAPALIDEAGRNEWDTVQLPIKEDGENFLISGRKILVPYAAIADELIVTAITKDKETVLLVVDPAIDGISITPHQSEVGTPLSMVNFSNAHVPRDRVIHSGDNSITAIHAGLRTGALLATAEAIGHCEAIKTISTKFVSQRHAFGQPIGAFQAVAHPCADMHINIETIRILTQQAAWLVDTGRGAAEEIESTKALANELFERLANDAFCMHGAHGYAEECDLQIFMRRIRGFCQTLGETHESLERAAQAVGM